MVKNKSQIKQKIQQKRGKKKRQRKRKQEYIKHTGQETERFKRGIKQIKKDVVKAPEIQGLKKVEEKVSLLQKIKNYGKKKTSIIQKDN